MSTDAGSVATGNPAEGTPPAGSEQGTVGAGAAQASDDNGIFSGLDADMRTFAENKGWHKDQNPVGAVLKSYKELEGKLGSAVTLPAEDDAEAWRKVYSKLGMPESADGYELKVPEKHNPEVEKQVRSMFHSAGLTKAQANTVYDEFMAMTAPYVEQQAQEAEAKALEAAAAAKELGDERMVGAKAAFAHFVGKDEALASTLERVLGDGDMIRFFDRVAQAMGEDGKGSLGIRSGSGGGDDNPETYRDIVNNAFNKKTG